MHDEDVQVKHSVKWLIASENDNGFICKMQTNVRDFSKMNYRVIIFPHC